METTQPLLALRAEPSTWRRLSFFLFSLSFHMIAPSQFLFYKSICGRWNILFLFVSPFWVDFSYWPQPRGCATGACVCVCARRRGFWPLDIYLIFFVVNFGCWHSIRSTRHVVAPHNHRLHFRSQKHSHWISFRNFRPTERKREREKERKMFISIYYYYYVLGFFFFVCLFLPFYCYLIACACFSISNDNNRPFVGWNGRRSCPIDR